RRAQRQRHARNQLHPARPESVAVAGGGRTSGVLSDRPPGQRSRTARQRRPFSADGAEFFSRLREGRGRFRHRPKLKKFPANQFFLDDAPPNSLRKREKRAKNSRPLLFFVWKTCSSYLR